MEEVFVTRSVEETEEAAGRVAASLADGGFILLFGELGAGKTAFVRGLAKGLGIDPDDVSSPTFTLIQPYAGTARTLQHVDLYRVQPGFEVDDLGLEDLVGQGDIVAIEWADRCSRVLRPAVRVSIDDLGDDHRRITVRTG
ncbi:MAG: tRNA (adenosine(37)-N6)-threonylcarbamoyltransferase complex ATPase subunit type 1 TsaE [Vicinamibacterales bacterium]